jgi:hypothetical protein
MEMFEVDEKSIDTAKNLDLCFAGEDVSSEGTFNATHVGTWHLGLFGLIRRSSPCSFYFE